MAIVERNSAFSVSAPWLKSYESQNRYQIDGTYTSDIHSQFVYENQITYDQMYQFQAYDCLWFHNKDTGDHWNDSYQNVGLE